MTSKSFKVERLCRGRLGTRHLVLGDSRALLAVHHGSSHCDLADILWPRRPGPRGCGEEGTVQAEGGGKAGGMLPGPAPAPHSPRPASLSPRIPRAWPRARCTWLPQECLRARLRSPKLPGTRLVLFCFGFGSSSLSCRSCFS